MKIRRAKEKDITRINELLFEVAKIHAEARPDIFKNASKKYSDSELIQIIGCDSTPIFVATDDSDFVLGYAFCVYQITKDNLLLQDKKTLYIDDLCIDANERGKHIGTALYEYVCDFAKKEGFDSITLNVWSFNEAACKFYQKCGMLPLKTVMEKSL